MDTETSRRDRLGCGSWTTWRMAITLGTLLSVATVAVLLQPAPSASAPPLDLDSLSTVPDTAPATSLAAMSPEETAAALAGMTPEDQAAILSTMPPKEAKAAMDFMTRADQVAVLAAMPSAYRAAVLKGVWPSDVPYVNPFKQFGTPCNDRSCTCYDAVCKKGESCIRQWIGGHKGTGGACGNPDAPRPKPDAPPPPCHNFNNVFGQSKCYDLYTIPMELLDQLASAIFGQPKSSFQAVDQIAVPILRIIVDALKTALEATKSVLKNFIDTNICFGDFSAETIMEASPSKDPDMYADTCNYMMFDDAKKADMYSLLSFGVSNDLLDLMGLCTVVGANPGKIAGACVAFNCDGSPTFAIQVTGPGVGCFFGNPIFDVASEGLSEIIGEAATVAVASAGFGVSMTPRFSSGQVTVWNGVDKLVETAVRGQVYGTFVLSLENAVPVWVSQYLEIKAVASAVMFLNINLESNSDLLFPSYPDFNPLKALKDLTKGAVMGTARLTVSVKLSEMTNGILTDFELGTMFAAEFALTTMPGSTLPAEGAYFLTTSNGIFPGTIFLQALSAGVKYVAENFGKVVDFLAGKEGVADAAVKAVDDTSQSSNQQHMGFYVSRAGWGIMLKFPVSSMTLLGSLLGDGLGVVTVQCQYHFSHEATSAFTCGFHYKAPKWVAAFKRGVEWVFGEITDRFTSAFKAIGSLFLKFGLPFIPFTFLNVPVNDTRPMINDARPMAAASSGGFSHAQYTMVHEAGYTNTSKLHPMMRQILA